MKKKPKSSKNQKNNQSNLSNYAKYSTIAFQMIAIILVGVFGGIKLDQVVRIEFPVFTVVLTIVSVILSMYYAIKDLL
ncbi:MAG: AtpZ/AtpI family protein [Bacteroidales bacterium]|nr:AtpZ/AtpI family protein [Bacteroidales bacterium]